MEYIKEQFFKYLYGEITLKEFEEWIYKYEELEVYLGKDHYIDLISFNFNSRDAKVYIKDLFKKKFNWEEFEYWRTTKLLTDILSGKIEIVLGTRLLRELYLEQEANLTTPLISIALGVGFESEIGGCPIQSEYHLWSKKDLKKYLEPIGWYRDQFYSTVKEELKKLNNQ